MKLSVTLQRLSTVGLACGGLMLASASWINPAHAQLTESDRASRLRALQSSVLSRPLSRPAGTASTSGESSSGQIGGVETIQMEPVTPSSPPLPEAGMQPIATVTPTNGQLSIDLVNNTGTAVSYEVIGDTSRRTLLLNESSMLRGVPLPTTITIVRQDEGFVGITAISSENGMLKISLEPRPSPDNAQSAIRIQADGQVFAN